MPLSCNINPNQNLIVAWLFSELYFCRESKFYHNQEFKDIVHNEVNAALSLMNSDGELSLSEDWPLVKDSNYGGYSSVILYTITQLWDNQDWTKALIAIGNWLYQSFPMTHPWNMQDDYPNWVKDRHYASNLAERIASWYVAGITTEYANKWSKFIVEKFQDYERYLPLKFYQLKTLPSDYYIDGFDEIGFDDPIIIEEGDNLKIIWRKIDGISINGKFFSPHQSGLISIDIANDEGDVVKIKETNTNRVYEYILDNSINRIKIIDYSHPFFK